MGVKSLPCAVTHVHPSGSEENQWTPEADGLNGDGVRERERKRYGVWMMDIRYLQCLIAGSLEKGKLCVSL